MLILHSYKPGDKGYPFEKGNETELNQVEVIRNTALAESARELSFKLQTLKNLKCQNLIKITKVLRDEDTFHLYYQYIKKSLIGHISTISSIKELNAVYEGIECCVSCLTKAHIKADLFIYNFGIDSNGLLRIFIPPEAQCSVSVEILSDFYEAEKTRLNLEIEELFYEIKNEKPPLIEQGKTEKPNFIISGNALIFVENKCSQNDLSSNITSKEEEHPISKGLSESHKKEIISSSKSQVNSTAENRQIQEKEKPTLIERPISSFEHSKEIRSKIQAEIEAKMQLTNQEKPNLLNNREELISVNNLKLAKKESNEQNSLELASKSKLPIITSGNNINTESKPTDPMKSSMAESEKAQTRNTSVKNISQNNHELATKDLIDQQLESNQKQLRLKYNLKIKIIDELEVTANSEEELDQIVVAKIKEYQSLKGISAISPEAKIESEVELIDPQRSFDREEEITYKIEQAKQKASNVLKSYARLKNKIVE